MNEGLRTTVLTLAMLIFTPPESELQSATSVPFVSLKNGQNKTLARILRIDFAAQLQCI